jgi:hypothetical protein
MALGHSLDALIAHAGSLYFAIPNTSPGSALFKQSTGYVDAQISNTDTPLLRLKTAHVPGAGLQGLQRIYKATVIGTLPTAQTSLTVTVAVGYDFDSNVFSGTFQITPANMKRTGDTVQFDVFPDRTKCQSIQFLIEQDASGSNTGLQILSINQIRLVVGLKGADNKLPASARATRV